MNKTALFAAAAIGMAVATAASAQMGPMGDPFGDATVARADFAKQSADRFAKMDANKDGSLTEDEMPGPAARMFSRLDGDGNGKVSADEFSQMQLRRFDMMDQNHDGQLTKAERDAVMAAMRARMGGSPPGN